MSVIKCHGRHSADYIATTKQQGAAVSQCNCTLSRNVKKTSYNFSLSHVIKPVFTIETQSDSEARNIAQSKRYNPCKHRTDLWTWVVFFWQSTQSNRVALLHRLRDAKWLKQHTVSRATNMYSVDQWIINILCLRLTSSDDPDLCVWSVVCYPFVWAFNSERGLQTNQHNGFR